jgi:acetylornithine deacetylase/succinyl-diaminopimelate desuccinylase-like protein
MTEKSAILPDPAAPRPARADAGVQAMADALRQDDVFLRAVAHARETDERTLDDQMELTAVPAPPFGEAHRGERFSKLLSECARDVSTDAVGNVVGWRGRRDGAAPLVVAAHLDTVFPPDTDVHVTRAGEVLRGPGIGDDGRGLAVLLALGRAMEAAGVTLRRPLLMVGTVGEEGVGDLRGVRHLFDDEGEARSAAAFVSLDGAGMARIVTRGVGSRRYRISVSGPGGHSWMDWGTPNPVHAMADAVSRMTREDTPGATLTVGRIQGGISINAIPEEAWMEVDVRSMEEAPMAAQEAHILNAVESAVARNQAAGRGSGTLSSAWERIGRRPAGATDDEELLVRAAVAATRALGTTPQLVASSTDANVPMDLGIPAVTLGGGGQAGQAHTLEEWYRNIEGPAGVARILMTLMVLDRLLALAD